MKNYQKVKITDKSLKRKTDRTHVRNLIIITNKLYKLYRHINKRLFDDKLPISQITFYPINGSYGEVIFESTKHFPVIVLNYEHFNLGIKHIIEILTHEMVHVYCTINNINEINYKNGYHNKKFKQVCEQIGLKCEKSANYGYNIVTIPNNLFIDFASFINDKKLVQLITNYN